MRASDAGRQPVEQLAGVAEMQADVAELVVVDRDQRLGDGVDESLAADEAACADWRSACAIRCSPPPKPISRRTSSSVVANSAAQIGGRGLA